MIPLKLQRETNEPRHPRRFLVPPPPRTAFPNQSATVRGNAKEKKRIKLFAPSYRAGYARIYYRGLFTAIYLGRDGSRWHTPIPRLCNRKHCIFRDACTGIAFFSISYALAAYRPRVSRTLSSRGLSERVHLTLDRGWQPDSCRQLRDRSSIAHIDESSSRPSSFARGKQFGAWALVSAGRIISHSMVNQIPVPQAKYELLTNIRQWVFRGEKGTPEGNRCTRPSWLFIINLLLIYIAHERGGRRGEG